MRHGIRATVLTVVLGSCAAVIPAASAAQDGGPRPRLERLGVAADGRPGNGPSSDVSVSSNGRFAVFVSHASNLVPGDTNGTADVFVRDLRRGTIERVSVAGDGRQADRESGSPSVSDDGRYVIFESSAGTLAPGSTPGQPNIFVRDRATRRTTVLVKEDKKQPTAQVHAPSVSADGRYVAFLSNRTDLVPGDTNAMTDAFVADRRTGTIKRVSVGSDGSQARLFSESPVISADGGTVGFMNAGSTLGEKSAPAAALGPRPRYFYVHDVRTGRTAKAATLPDGSGAGVDDIGLSPDGRFALFSSRDAQIVPGDTNRKADVFAKDLRSGATRRISLATDGSQADGASRGAVMSADHRRVFFTSDASGLVPGDTNDRSDVFARDLLTGAVERLGVRADGSQSTAGDARGVRADAAGRTVVFEAPGDLTPGGTPEQTEVYVRRRA
ncbi:hypothetical protein LE181_16540 [Streptomyces sp. SCA3-4]|uniref:TolB family protein n=1 Tax=Streptomyces sichuanensis TaxID=2871810 RepID=UPI001CE342A3|nr:hypothetical protein [Streptomyces sichuanensis]MCA6093763.1 hypothetical protein [Streptomyces sichuanensis]